MGDQNLGIILYIVFEINMIAIEKMQEEVHVRMQQIYKGWPLEL